MSSTGLADILLDKSDESREGTTSGDDDITVDVFSVEVSFAVIKW